MENKIITRIWHGVTKAEDSEVYLQYLKKTGIEDYKKTEAVDVSNQVCAAA